MNTSPTLFASVLFADFLADLWSWVMAPINWAGASTANSMQVVVVGMMIALFFLFRARNK